MDEPSAAIKAARARLKDKFKKNARLNIRLLLLPLRCVPANMKFRGGRSIAATRVRPTARPTPALFPRPVLLKKRMEEDK